MSLQEQIRKVLRETVNESTFFRRRVDMGLMEKEFFENLNYVTDSFIYKLKQGISFDFGTFKRRVINRLMDDYHNELSDGGSNDFPYDEVYEFVSNHFEDKIKDRYDTFFGNKINESEIKEGKYISVLKDLTEQFKDEDCLCDIEVKYVGGENDLYFVELILSNRDLDNKFNGSSFRIRDYTQKLKRKVNDGIYEYLPISFLVKFRDTPNCSDYKNLNESNDKNKTQEFQKLIDEEVESMKEICKQMGADDEEIISFDTCDFLELDPKVMVTEVSKFYGKLRILVVIKYEAAMHFHDEESFIYELQSRLKWVGNIMVDVEDVINTYPNDKRQ